MTENIYKFSFLPEKRMNSDFPWQIWLAGWVLILKAIFWIATEADVSDQVSTVLGYKYILFLVPFLIAGIGIWNFKRWAFFTIVSLCLLDFIWFIAYPAAIGSLAINRVSLVTVVFSWAVYIVNGPASSILLVILSPSLFKLTGK